jgi:hypothetical protein
MLQRSPTYLVTGRNVNEIADMLRELEIPEELFQGIRNYLCDDYDLGDHFTPKYQPWRQRIAFVPDGDLFQGIASGQASVVTDEIESFTETGILLKSGDTLEAGIPNMAWVFGYFRASWTLKADMIGDFVCRLLQHMDELGASVVVPELREEDAAMPLLPWVDPENSNPGYLKRGMHLLRRQGDRDPWRRTQDYWIEKDDILAADLDDGALLFE